MYMPIQPTRLSIIWFVSCRAILREDKRDEGKDDSANASLTEQISYTDVGMIYTAPFSSHAGRQSRFNYLARLITTSEDYYRA